MGVGGLKYDFKWLSSFKVIVCVRKNQNDEIMFDIEFFFSFKFTCQVVHGQNMLSNKRNDSKHFLKKKTTKMA